MRTIAVLVWIFGIFPSPIICGKGEVQNKTANNTRRHNTNPWMTSLAHSVAKSALDTGYTQFAQDVIDGRPTQSERYSFEDDSSVFDETGPQVMKDIKKMNQNNNAPEPPGNYAAEVAAYLSPGIGDPPSDMPAGLAQTDVIKNYNAPNAISGAMPNSLPKGMPNPMPNAMSNVISNAMSMPMPIGLPINSGLKIGNVSPPPNVEGNASQLHKGVITPGQLHIDVNAPDALPSITASGYADNIRADESSAKLLNQMLGRVQETPLAVGQPSITSPVEPVINPPGESPINHQGESPMVISNNQNSQAAPSPLVTIIPASRIQLGLTETTQNKEQQFAKKEETNDKNAKVQAPGIVDDSDQLTLKPKKTKNVTGSMRQGGKGLHPELSTNQGDNNEGEEQLAVSLRKTLLGNVKEMLRAGEKSKQLLEQIQADPYAEIGFPGPHLGGNKNVNIRKVDANAVGRHSVHVNLFGDNSNSENGKCLKTKKAKNEAGLNSNKRHSVHVNLFDDCDEYAKTNKGDEAEMKKLKQIVTHHVKSGRQEESTKADVDFRHSEEDLGKEELTSVQEVIKQSQTKAIKEESVHKDVKGSKVLTNDAVEEMQGAPSEGNNANVFVKVTKVEDKVKEILKHVETKEATRNPKQMKLMKEREKSNEMKDEADANAEPTEEENSNSFQEGNGLEESKEEKGKLINHQKQVKEVKVKLKEEEQMLKEKKLSDEKARKEEKQINTAKVETTKEYSDISEVKDNQWQLTIPNTNFNEKNVKMMLQMIRNEEAKGNGTATAEKEAVAAEKAALKVSNQSKPKKLDVNEAGKQLANSVVYIKNSPETNENEKNNEGEETFINKAEKNSNPDYLSVGNSEEKEAIETLAVKTKENEKMSNRKEDVDANALQEAIKQLEVLEKMRGRKLDQQKRANELITENWRLHNAHKADVAMVNKMILIDSRMSTPPGAFSPYHDDMPVAGIENVNAVLSTDSPSSKEISEAELEAIYRPVNTTQYKVYNKAPTQATHHNVQKEEETISTEAKEPTKEKETIFEHVYQEKKLSRENEKEPPAKDKEPLQGKITEYPKKGHNSPGEHNIGDSSEKTLKKPSGGGHETMDDKVERLFSAHESVHAHAQEDKHSHGKQYKAPSDENKERLPVEGKESMKERQDEVLKQQKEPRKEYSFSTDNKAETSLVEGKKQYGKEDTQVKKQEGKTTEYLLSTHENGPKGQKQNTFSGESKYKNLKEKEVMQDTKPEKDEESQDRLLSHEKKPGEQNQAKFFGYSKFKKLKEKLKEELMEELHQELRQKYVESDKEGKMGNQLPMRVEKQKGQKQVKVLDESKPKRPKEKEDKQDTKPEKEEEAEDQSPNYEKLTNGQKQVKMVGEHSSSGTQKEKEDTQQQKDEKEAQKSDDKSSQKLKQSQTNERKKLMEDKKPGKDKNTNGEFSIQEKQPDRKKGKKFTEDVQEPETLEGEQNRRPQEETEDRLPTQEKGTKQGTSSGESKGSRKPEEKQISNELNAEKTTGNEILFSANDAPDVYKLMENMDRQHKERKKEEEYSKYQRLTTFIKGIKDTTRMSGNDLDHTYANIQVHV